MSTANIRCGLKVIVQLQAKLFNPYAMRDLRNLWISFFSKIRFSSVMKGLQKQQHIFENLLILKSFF